MTTNQLAHSPQKAFLLGFTPFLLKELQEWKRKRTTIFLFLAIPFLVSILGVVLSRLVAQQGGNSALQPDLTLAATSFSVNTFWVIATAVLPSIGLITKELDAGTLAWNLTKPLSRFSFLLVKWLTTTLIVWFVAIVLANLIAFAVGALGFGWSSLNLSEVIAGQIVGFCAVGFWVLVCVLLGLWLKDQSAVVAGTLMIAVGGHALNLLPNPQIKRFAPFYPSNTIDWVISPNRFELIAYLVYMIGMAIAAKWLFDRKEFS